MLRLPVVFEDYPVKFLVLCGERSGCIDWVKLGQSRNWNKLGFRITGVHVVKTSKSVIIHPGPLKGFDVDQLEIDSGRIVERVRYLLEVKFGMQLSEDCSFLHGPMWQVYRPEAREWIKAGSVKIAGVGAVDASPKPWLKSLSRVPHVEFEKKGHAAIAAAWPVATDPAKRNVSAAPMYPLYLEEVHRLVVGLVGQIEALTLEMGSVKRFESEVTLVMGDLQKLLGLDVDIACGFVRRHNGVGLILGFLDENMTVWYLPLNAVKGKILSGWIMTGTSCVLIKRCVFEGGYRFKFDPCVIPDILFMFQVQQMGFVAKNQPNNIQRPS